MPRKRAGFYSHRTTRRDCHNRSAHCTALACGSGGARGGPPGPVRKQSQADRAGPAELLACVERCCYRRRASISAGTTPRPNQNYSVYVRMLPFMELSSAYNAWNHTFGARWNNDSPIQYEMPNGTVIVSVVTSFLCPSDTNPGGSPPLNYFQNTGNRQASGNCNYPVNVGLNRHINNAPPGSPCQWQLDDERSVLRHQRLGYRRHRKPPLELWPRSPTARVRPRFSVNGSRAPRPAYRTRTALGMVYTGPNSAAYMPDIQFALACAAIIPSICEPELGLEGRMVGIWRHDDLLAYQLAQPDGIRVQRSRSGRPGDDDPGQSQLEPPGWRERMLSWTARAGLCGLALTASRGKRSRPPTGTTHSPGTSSEQVLPGFDKLLICDERRRQRAFFHALGRLRSSCLPSLAAPSYSMRLAR